MPCRVLFAAHSALRGGAEYCLDTTLRHLDRQVIEPTVIFPHEGPMIDTVRELGIDYYIQPMHRWIHTHKSLWYWKNITLNLIPDIRQKCRLIRQKQIDAVYSNCTTVFDSAIAAKCCGVPHIWHIHEVLKQGSRMKQLLPLPVMKRLIYHLSDRVVFESEASRRIFEESTLGDRSSVVYNSVRVDDALQSPGSDDSLTCQLKLRTGDRLIGFVGQFIDRKNPLLLIDAVSRLRNKGDVKCLFVGEGPLESAMVDRIRELDLKDVCFIVPFQPDIAPIMKVIDILVLPSREESFGLVLVEAAKFNKPSIACRSQGPCEIIVDGETGYLVAPGDAAAIADRIDTLLQNSVLCQRMGRNAARRAAMLYDAATNTRRIEQLIQETLRTSGISRDADCESEVNAAPSDSVPEKMIVE